MAEAKVAAFRPPLRADHPDAPKYWTNETSGVLKPVIEVYLSGKLMTLREVAVMRAYLRQWIMSPVWDMNPRRTNGDALTLAALRERIDSIVTRLDIERWLAAALESGIDPL